MREKEGKKGKEKKKKKEKKGKGEKGGKKKREFFFKIIGPWFIRAVQKKIFLGLETMGNHCL